MPDRPAPAAAGLRGPSLGDPGEGGAPGGSLPIAPDSPDGPPALAAEGLRVAYPAKRGPVEALRGLDLRVPRGSLFVLLGPNGAGKTTLMRCITGLARPAGGTLRVLGEEAGAARREERLRRIGVLIENPGVYGRLDAREYLAFFAGFYARADGRPAAARDRVAELCEGFGLALDGKPVARLSQGNRQKLQLVRSLLHSPELLLWDEPTDHLDPEAQARVLGYLRRYLAEAGATALVATHRLEQMEALGTHFGFLRAGRMAASGSRDGILAGGEERVRVVFARDLPAEAPAAAARALGLEAASGPVAGRNGSVGAATVFSGPGLADKVPALVRTLVEGGLPIRAVEPLRPGLAEVYAQVMEP